LAKHPPLRRLGRAVLRHRRTPKTRRPTLPRRHPGAIPRTELRQITAATYHQVWWPAHDQLVYTDERLPVWDTRAKAFTDPDTGTPLPTFDQACQDLAEPAHVVRFGTQVHVKGILGGTEEAGRHIGYLTKYLTKSIGQAAGLGEHATDTQRDHLRRLHAELSVTPCSPRYPIWLLYGIQPRGARHAMTPGRCKGKAHQPDHLGIAGRRVLVSRKWSNKTLDDHRAERGEFVRQLLQAAGIQPNHGLQDGPCRWERPAPADPDVPPRPMLLLRAVAERQRWKAEYTAAQLATSDSPPSKNCPATNDQAA
jgi:hypothetical protein